MKNIPYERLHEFEKKVKRMYRRYKNKLKKDELAGYVFFRLLVAHVAKSERFLVDKDCFENFSETLQASKEKESNHNRGDVTDCKLSLLKNLDLMNFNSCVAVETAHASRNRFDVFTCFEFTEDSERTESIVFFSIFHKEVQNIEDKEQFKLFLARFYRDHFTLVPRRKSDEKTKLYYTTAHKLDPNFYLEASYCMAEALSAIFLHKQADHAAAPLARMTDCIFTRTGNGAYEAKNHYTYVCDQDTAPRYRRLVNEKHRSHGFTGRGGTKAFHYKSPHWRYYASKDEYVFVRGFFAGRHKPEVNVIR